MMEAPTNGIFELGFRNETFLDMNALDVFFRPQTVQFRFV